MRTLLVDNHDSFTFNLAHLIAEVCGVEPTVVTNDERRWDEIDLDDFDAVVVSPGPGRPETSRDVGISTAAIRDSGLPVLGVCLGHQALCHLLGATVERSPAPHHGRTSPVHHGGVGLFAGIPSPFLAVRYHSLEVADLPASLEPIAWTDDGVLMAAADRSAPRWGVQFHPESVLTEHGHALLANFRDLALGARPARRRRPPRATPVERPQEVARHRVRTRRLGFEVDPATAFVGLFGDAPVAFWLDGEARRPGRERISVLGDASGPLAEVVTYDVARGEVTVDSRAGVRTEQGPLLDWLERALASRRAVDAELPFDFAPGYVGYLGYELKAECGGVARHDAPTPDAALVFADRAVVVDHDRGATWLVALDDHDHRGETDAWLDATSDRLGRLVASGRHPDPRPAARPDAPVQVAFRHTPDAYLDLVAECQRRIRDGESYEICLTNMLTVPRPTDPLATYLAHRRTNPAPHAAYLRLPGVEVVSASPEQLLHVGRDRVVTTRPIKGTAPRGSTPDEDAALAEALRTSEKERAENLMIVDLSRHDLGRVCEVGSVAVDALFEVETYPTVHQLVSTVRGRLRERLGAVDAVRAVFPAGSMTGAPKLRTMEIIDELEGGPRGVYSGAIGYLATTGTADLAVTIRTLVAHGEEATLGVGGAIVVDSDPRAELREAMLKASAVLATLAAQSAEVSPTGQLTPVPWSGQ